MRTTLTIDDDLLEQLKQEAARTRRSVRQVLNEWLRRGSFGGQPPESGERFEVRPFQTEGFAPGVIPERLNQLADELETERAKP